MKMAKVRQINKSKLCTKMRKAESCNKKKGSTFTQKPLTHIIAGGSFFLFVKWFHEKMNLFSVRNEWKVQ